jgi:hypothetical protein
VLRSEATPDQLIVAYFEQFGKAGEWDGIIRLKWILNSAASSQTNEEQLIVLATREKNKTL